MAEENQDPSVGFRVDKLYIKDVSYESSNVPHIFSEMREPQLNVQLNIEHAVLNETDGVYEVVLALTATAKYQNSPIFLAEVHQAGVFHVIGLPNEDLPKVLEITCPTILLPFAREVICDMVIKGGFPQLLIAPVNFEALYEQKHAAKQKQAGNQ